MSDSNPDLDSNLSDSDSRKLRWIRIRVDSDSRQADSDPDSRCPDSHITGMGQSLRLMISADGHTSKSSCLIFPLKSFPRYLMDVPHEPMYICRYVTAFTTCVTGVGYMFAKDTFKIFNKKMGK